MSYVRLRIESFAQDRHSPLPLGLCQQCGALVGNEEAHDEWHMKFGMEREQ